jgi:hypothetical protein
MHFSPIPYYFIPVRSKNDPQFPVLMFFPLHPPLNMRDQLHTHTELQEIDFVHNIAAPMENKN